MTKFIVVLGIAVLAGCHTASGVLHGAGKDIQAAGKWMEPKPAVDLREKK